MHCYFCSKTLLLLAVATLMHHGWAFLANEGAQRLLVAEKSFFRHLAVMKSAKSLEWELFYQDPKTPTRDIEQRRVDKASQRFQREAAKEKAIDGECILTIHGNRYNMTAWATAHPGGAKILQKFHNSDASIAFDAAHHSSAAYSMLGDFLIVEDVGDATGSGSKADGNGVVVPEASLQRQLLRVRHKLFTREDPVGIHKYLGLFCLINFIGRFRQMLFGDPAAGLGTRGQPWFSMACLIPHAVLSLSSLIFETVPRERVVGKPMIWQEYRIHNIIFGVRSVLAAFLAAMTIRLGNGPRVRFAAILFCGSSVLAANYGANVATEKLRVVEQESTTATMPYWDGCCIETQLRFKEFYAYCQFMATLACLAVGNPAWALSVLLAIQMASLLMTLVRKGLLSARGYHYGYTACLVMPWFVGFRSVYLTKTPEFPILVGLGYAMYKLRRQGVNKYLLWMPVILARVFIGDRFISYMVW